MAGGQRSPADDAKTSKTHPLLSGHQDYETTTAAKAEARNRNSPSIASGNTAAAARCTLAYHVVQCVVAFPEVQFNLFQPPVLPAVATRAAVRVPSCLCVSAHMSISSGRACIRRTRVSACDRACAVVRVRVRKDSWCMCACVWTLARMRAPGTRVKRRTFYNRPVCSRRSAQDR